ncbi:hypothetical protein BU24DRAFT_390871 [Aaosphaeria arxii CBS 175.79]|uniref:Nuclear pore complex protein An-Nup82 n=1 Tax=Aaosphaeria arxii CBS 175.79 TaxID=1450172 RepID=A0A6A5XQX9_9PLEO|nr:uncharacterized protein BU24DRAFT_390871 [Aaosphaeria arxii CBS 175.79]KAF2015582.1 hypothetical protein BU24DRAFT_390871 [Aaosphaeria arxii CBS 175.79]
MPRVISYTPPWLMRPSSGYQLFAPKQSTSTALVPKQAPGKRKTIATRGSEIFTAVGTEIRWADLAALKDGLDSSRTLKLSVPFPITQLVVSPYNDYIAVATSHTIHVAILPDSSLLNSDDDSPIKLKAFQIGPLAHVREESPLASVLWHPLGYHGRCLVTITQDGIVRLWEINRTDRSSFAEPALSVDLKKLANAENDEDDLSASKLGATKGFSPDSFELEVASACFGDFPEQEGVHGWAPMTLWVAMVEGDLYALCPLLPSKWQLVEADSSNTIMETLATSINVAHEDSQENKDTPAEEVETAQKQLSWLSDIIYSEPFQEVTPFGESIKVYTRPNSVPAVPLLQGPFSISSQGLDDFELTDLIVFSLKTFTDGEDGEPAEGLPAAVVCILTDTAKVHICLDLEGIVGRWLPSATDDFSASKPVEHNLVLLETLVLTKEETSTYSQSITTDVHTDFSFFVSHPSGIFYISLESWVRNLEEELANPQSEGMQFRLTRMLDSATTHLELCLPRPASNSGAAVPDNATSCIAIEDGNIGYFLLTTFDNEPHAVILDAPEDGMPTEEQLAEYMEVGTLPMQTRPAYQPPKELYEPLQSVAGLDKLIPQRHRASLKEEIRLSPANLNILMDVHRVLSDDTQKLQRAVADLFRRCQRLQDEYRDQIFRTSQAMTNIEAVTGNDGTDSNGEVNEHSAAKIDERLERVKSRQEEINARYEAIRRKMASVGGSELSEKEAGLVEELQVMERSLDPSAQTLTDDADGSDIPAWQRLEKIKQLKKTLTKQAEQTLSAIQEQRAAGDTGVKVPSHSRKQENEQIEALLQRETALVEAATNRLRSLGVSIPQVEGN